MKWIIPGKTFLVGEYAALKGAGALLITTIPCFEVSLCDKNDDNILLEDSVAPATKFWRSKNSNKVIKFCDPYNGIGGMGASSAYFLGAYYANIYEEGINKSKTIPNLDIDDLLHNYLNFAWNNIGRAPSGYDVIAQSLDNCVYVNRQKNIIESFPWPFTDISFSLFHTGKKLATHEHLKTTALPNDNAIIKLNKIVDLAKDAFMSIDSQKLIDAVNFYYQDLASLNLIAPHTKKLIQAISTKKEVLAIKGCGALGADVLLVIHKTSDIELRKELICDDLQLLATNLYNKPILMQNNM